MIPARIDVLASLHFTWASDDLGEPVCHYMAIATAPSPTKDALSLGWLEGELVPEGGGLAGELRLTDLGREQLLAFRCGLEQSRRAECESKASLRDIFETAFSALVPPPVERDQEREAKIIALAKSAYKDDKS